MTINPYILNGLYQQGIIDFVPMDLGFAPNVSAMNYVSGDTYMKNAMQGQMYQNYNNRQDTYVRNFNQQIGTHSSAADNAMSLQGIGTNAPSGITALGAAGIGANGPDPSSTLGFSGVGNQYSVTDNALGGFSDVKRSFSQTVTAFHNTPTIIKGIVSTLIAGTGLYLYLKKGKKPAKKPSLLSRLNPMNWFKSSKKK